MSILQKQNFEGMDKDTALVFVKQGSYRDALNVHVGSSKNGNIGILEIVPGNTLVTNSSLPVGTNTVIGSYEDRQNNRIIFLLCNSNGNHGMYSYDNGSGTISLLIRYSGFNFSPDHLITGIGYINGLVPFSDNYNQPRLVDLNHISAYGGNYSEEMISLIKKVPPYPPLVTRKKDASYINNFILKKTFQFAIRFIYLDNSKSKLSPYSYLSVNTVIGSIQTVAISGGPTKYAQISTPDDNNYIEVNLNISELLSSNMIAMVKKVEVLVREGNTGAWSIFKTLSSTEFTSSQIVNFYNDLNEIAVDQSEISEDYDSVPLRSAALAVIKNRIFLGGNVEGFDPPSGILQSVTPSYTPIYSTTPMPNGVLPVSNTVLGSRPFKDRGIYNVGLVWYDKYGRHTGVADSTKVVVYANPQNSFSNVCNAINVTLNGTPPVFAHYYGVVRTKNLHQGFFQELSSSGATYVSSIDDDGTIHVQFVTNGGQFLETHIFYNAGQNISYNFTQGDRIYVMYKDGTTLKSVDLPILKKQNTTESGPGRTVSGNNLVVDFFDFKDGIKFVEVYTPAIQEGLFYEVGKVFPVNNPEQSNRSLSATSISLENGDCYFNLRILGIGVSSQIVTNFPVESMGLFKENYDISTTDIGRANAVVPDEKSIYKDTNIRFSNLWIQGSNINGLSTFAGLNEKPLPIEFGSITKLQVASNIESDTNVLLSIHTKEIASLYIEEAVFSQVSGQTTVAISDSVIPSVRALRGSLGSINPESIVQYNGSVYGWDAIKGVVWRYAADGLNPISDIFMRNYFYNKSRSLLSITGFKAFGGYDPYYDEYILSFDSGDSTVLETIAFSEKINRWTTFYSYIPEGMQRIATNFVSFKSGQVYVHGNNTCNNFYGVQYTSKVTPVCNIEPSKEKILLNISTESDDVWVATSIKTPEGQETNNIEADYFHLANAWGANVLRDINTPNAILKAGQLPLLSGDVIRSSVFTAELENTKTSMSTLRFANFKVIASERSNK